MAMYAQMHPIYQPAMRIISSISNSFPANVTTTFAHQYITGTIVRLDIPLGYGMPQANQQFGPILVTGSTTFSIPIDTTHFDPFAAPDSYPLNAQQAQVVPFGEVSSTLEAATVNVLNPNM
jgi:hypothetical protein